MSCLPLLEQFLQARNARFTHSVHPAAYTARQVATAAHLVPREVAKVVIVVAETGCHMIVLPADLALDLSELRESLGLARARLATERELAELFPDCELGAMPPFGNLYRMPVYADSSLAQAETITFNAGTHKDALTMSFAEYKRLAHPTVLPLWEVGVGREW